MSTAIHQMHEQTINEPINHWLNHSKQRNHPMDHVTTVNNQANLSIKRKTDQLPNQSIKNNHPSIRQPTNQAAIQAVHKRSTIWGLPLLPIPPIDLHLLLQLERRQPSGNRLAQGERQAAQITNPEPDEERDKDRVHLGSHVHG